MPLVPVLQSDCNERNSVLYVHAIITLIYVCHSAYLFISVLIEKVEGLMDISKLPRNVPILLYGTLIQYKQLSHAHE